MIPRYDSVNPMSLSTDDFSAFFTSHYLKDILVYPFQLAFRFLPWTFLAWPAFCVAYYPLDKNPIFSRFLRTIFLSLFVPIGMLNRYLSSNGFINFLVSSAIFSSSIFNFLSSFLMWLFLSESSFGKLKIFNFLSKLNYLKISSILGCLSILEDFI